MPIVSLSIQFSGLLLQLCSGGVLLVCGLPQNMTEIMKTLFRASFVTPNCVVHFYISKGQLNVRAFNFSAFIVFICIICSAINSFDREFLSDMWRCA